MNMLPGSALLLLLVLSSTASCFQLLPDEAAPRRARFSANSPTDVARCLNGAVAVGCGFFSCLENSTCDTDGMHEICELFFHTAATFNTEGKTFVKKSLQCISQGITARVFQTIRRCNIFQRMIAEVQEECYTSLDICTVARTNPDAIGEVVQVPTHFPNRSGPRTQTPPLVCMLVQVLQHPAADAAGLRRADGGSGEGRPHRQVRPRHGDLPPARPEQTLLQRLRLGRLQQPRQLEEHACVQHPARLQRQRPNSPVRQKEISDMAH